MEWTVISLGLSYFGVSVAFIGLMSRMFRNQFDRRFEVIDQRFEAIDQRFDRVEDKIDNLATDHQSLARELSEFRGGMRGRDPAILRRHRVSPHMSLRPARAQQRSLFWREHRKRVVPH